MSCEELLRRLTDYAEGSLDAGLCSELQRHLADCAPCSELQQDLQDLARLCRECDAPRLPDSLRRRLQARLSAGRPPAL